MKKGNDILKDCTELKQMPFSVPEGYFESFKKENAMPVCRKVSLWNRMAPYAAMAAVFVFLVSAGTFLLEKSSPDYNMTEEDYVMFADNMMNTIAYEMEFGSQIAEADLSDEDIINYLIYTGVTAEHIELSK
jgi:hypothetical protein